jgi:SNF2 family DNA or RNA helicase
MYDFFEIRKVLVIAPLRVARDTWPSEIEKWDHLKGLTYSVAVGDEKQRIAAVMAKTNICIINRENVGWLVDTFGADIGADMIVLDELSSYKDHKTKRFKSLLKMRPYVKRIVGLTGTPSSNGLMDLWAEFRVLDNGERLGRYITRYRNAYFVPDKRSADRIFSYKPAEGAEEMIYNRISDITISMKSSDYLKLPECVINEVPVYMSAEERQVYDTFKAEMTASIKGRDIDAANAAVLSGKLLQMANGAVYDEDKNVIVIHDRKLDALETLIEEANGKPVLVAYWFQHDADRIRKRFDVREIKSSEDIADWNAGKIPVALIHPASAGHGLNLQQGGSTMILFSMFWSLELYQQVLKRIHRQGQKHTVVIHHIIAKGTIDEDVMKALQRKEKTQNALIEAVKANLNVR